MDPRCHFSYDIILCIMCKVYNITIYYIVIDGATLFAVENLNSHTAVDNLQVCIIIYYLYVLWCIPILRISYEHFFFFLRWYNILFRYIIKRRRWCTHKRTFVVLAQPILPIDRSAGTAFVNAIIIYDRDCPEYIIIIWYVNYNTPAITARVPVVWSTERIYNSYDFRIEKRIFGRRWYYVPI